MAHRVALQRVRTGALGVGRVDRERLHRERSLDEAARERVPGHRLPSACDRPTLQLPSEPTDQGEPRPSGSHTRRTTIAQR